MEANFKASLARVCMASAFIIANNEGNSALTTLNLQAKECKPWKYSLSYMKSIILIYCGAYIASWEQFSVLCLVTNLSVVSALGNSHSTYIQKEIHVLMKKTKHFSNKCSVKKQKQTNKKLKIQQQCISGGFLYLYT